MCVKNVGTFSYQLKGEKLHLSLITPIGKGRRRYKVGAWFAQVHGSAEAQVKAGLSAIKAELATGAPSPDKVLYPATTPLRERVP